MNERNMEFRVGIVLLATLLVAGILVLTFVGTTPLFQSTYTIYIRFNEAPGVSHGTPVRKAGIRIGQVQSVEFAPNDEAVLVTAEIESNRHVYREEACELARSLLLGDTNIEFVRLPGAPADRTSLVNGDKVQGRVAPEISNSLAGLQQQAVRTLDTIDKAGHDMQDVMVRVDRLLTVNETKIDRLIDESTVTMTLLQKTLSDTNDIMGDPQLRAQIKRTIAEMPDILQQVKTTVDKAGGTLASMQQNMQNLEGLTGPLGARGDALVKDASESMHKLNMLSDNLLQFSQGLSTSDGSFGALLHDKRELYDRVDRLLKDVDGLTHELQPIIDNVQVFTDKIARHPGDLGVRGALKKDSGLKNDTEGEQPTARRWPLSGGGSWSMGQGR